MGIEFLVTAFIVTASPGTGVVYTVATGLARGFRASVVAAFGCTLGIISHMVAAIAGVAAILHTSAVVFQGFKILGILYLLYLAWTMLRQRGALKIESGKDGGERRSALKVIVTAIMINLLNPKLSIFFLAFLPQFVRAGDPNSLLTMIRLSAVFMLMTLVVFVCYGLFASKVRDHVISRPRVMAWIRRVFATAFVALGVQLALASR